MNFNVENLLLLFLAFCLFGWFIELFYRSYKAKKMANPGFLSGPYVPIYGIGGFIAYFSFLYSDHLSVVGSFLFFIGLVTVVELLTGVFFEKVFKIRLWDYSDRKFDFKGHICPRFLFYWLLLGVVFKYILFTPFDRMAGMEINPTQIFFLGLVYGVFSVDLVQSFNLAYRIRTTINQFGESQISPKVFALKNLYRDASSELNKKVDLNGKALGLKEGGLYVINYFRLTRNIREELQKAINKKLQNEKEN